MCKTRFFICKHCGNLIGFIHSSGAPITCCGDEMTELLPNTVDASHEKHVPVVTIADHKVTVKIGSVAHPMTEEHSIQWIYLQTKTGGKRECLVPGNAPEVTFILGEETPISVFAYCNLHGLWKTEIE